MLFEPFCLQTQNGHMRFLSALQTWRKKKSDRMRGVRKTVTKKSTATAIQDWLQTKLFYGVFPMKRLTFCEFKIDSSNVELRYSDGSILAIDCTAVENSVKTTINGRSELDWLIYNAPY